MSALGWPLLLLALGLILLISEVFIPSGGLIGFLAVSCVGLSLWKAFQHSYDLGLKCTLIHDACATRDLAFGRSRPKTFRRLSWRPSAGGTPT